MENEGFGLVVAIFVIAVTVIVLWRNRNKRKPKLEQPPTRWRHLMSVEHHGELTRSMVVHWSVKLKDKSAPFYSYRIDREQAAGVIVPLNVIASDHLGTPMRMEQQGTELDTDVKPGNVTYHLYALYRTDIHPVNLGRVNMVAQPSVITAPARRHTDVEGAQT